MARKTYLEESHIQDLERMNEEEMNRIPPQQMIALLRGLLKSYRMAASVANAAWALWKSMTEPKSLFKPAESEDALQTALSGYSPGNFNPSAQYLTLLCQDLEELYNDMEQCPTSQDCMNLLYDKLVDRMEKLREVQSGR